MLYIPILYKLATISTVLPSYKSPYWNLRIGMSKIGLSNHTQPQVSLSLVPTNQIHLNHTDFVASERESQ